MKKKKTLGTVFYSSNNSGGYWWLTTDHWLALEKAGWNVYWEKKPFLGALARCAAKHCTSLEGAKREFEKITGENPNAIGCPCCGIPHNFSWEDRKVRLSKNFYSDQFGNR